MKLWNLAFLGSLALMGCGSSSENSGWENKWDGGQAKKSDPTPEQAAANRERPYKEGIAALEIYVTEQGCESDNAKSIKTNIGELEEYTANFHAIGMTYYADQARNNHTDLSFKYGEAALKKKCLDAADEVYRGLVSFYVGDIYSGIRERAKIGIDDVRALRQSEKKSE